MGKEYTVVVHEAEEGGYWVEVPALPACFTQGESVEEVLENAKEAIEFHLEALQEDGQDIPLEDVVSLRKVEIAV